MSRFAQRASRRHARRALIVPLAVLGASAVAAAPASAENVHVLTQTITGFGPTVFQYPRGVAVDNSNGPSAGDFYVADQNHARVEKFSETGAFLLMWGKEVNEGTGNPNLCTNAGPPTDKCKFGANGNGEGFVPQPTAISVDSSNGPSAGDIYVIGGEAVVEKFNPSGHPISSWGGTPYPGSLDGSNSPSGPFEYGMEGIATDTSGNLYTWTPNSSRLFKFAQDGTALTSFKAATRESVYGGFTEGGGDFFKFNRGPTEIQDSIEMFGPTGTDIGQVNTGTVASHTLAYDESRDDLFTIGYQYPAPPHIEIYHFNGAGEVVQADSTTCKPAPNSGCQPSETFGSEDFQYTPNEIGVNEATGAVYISEPGEGETAAKIMVYKPINVPKVTTGAISGLARDSVEFSGHVDPDGAGEVSTCEFEYGTTKAYGSSATCSPASAATATDVSAQLPDETLASATTYHYRLLAGNANGNRPGKDLTFTTPPAVGSVSTDAPTEVGKLAATLNGSFSGDGVDTSYYFEFGPTASYGQSTPVVDQGTATGTQSVSANAEQLYAYYTYHYRVVAQNKYGTTVGADHSFLTLAPDLPSVESTFPSEVGKDSATLNARIATGEGSTVYRFDYGTSEEYGSRTSVEGPIEPESPDNLAKAELLELTPGTTYHFRVIATNFTGTTVGPDETFTTPSAPSVLSTSVSSLGRTTATLQATISPGLSLTTSHFDYGPSSSFGSSTSESAPIGPDDAIHSVAAALTGLMPGTTYHFRAVATNSIDLAVGPDQTFTTSPAETEKHEEPKMKPCKKGLVRKSGKCVRKKRPPHHKRHHRHGSAAHA